MITVVFIGFSVILALIAILTYMHVITANEIANVRAYYDNQLDHAKKSILGIIRNQELQEKNNEILERRIKDLQNQLNELKK